MSGGVGGISDAALQLQLISNATSIKQQMDQLTAESSSGYISDTYAGLGSAASIPLDLNPQIAQANTWSSNATAGNAWASVAQTAITQLGSIASTFLSDTVSLASDSSSQVATIASEASQALQQVASLLNTKSGNDYVFAGDDTGNPPVPNAQDPTTWPLYTAVQAAMGGLGTVGAAATDAATLAAATDPANSPFSSTIGTTPTAVQVGPDQTVQTGMVANQNLAAVQSGPETTGSWTVDLMRSLSMIASLTPAQVTLGAPYSALLSSINTTLTGVVSAAGTDAGVLGAQQDTLTNAQTGLSATVTALTNQVSSAQEVNLPTVASQLAQVQAQLQASYKLISEQSTFSLATYLPVP